MLGRILFFFSNEFFRVSFYSAIAAVVRILTILVIGKIVAILVGPEGLALVGQLSNFTVFVLVLGGTCISQGVTKYIAEYNIRNKDELGALLSASLLFYLIAALFIATLLIVFSGYISTEVLFSAEYYSIFIILGLSLLLMSLNNFLLSVVNGYKKYRLFNLLQIIGNILGLTVSVLLVYFYRLYGALLSVAISQAFAFFLNIIMLRNESWFNRKNFKPAFNKPILKKLALYAVLAILSTALYPLVTMCARYFIIKGTSLEAAGLYELVMRISGSCLLFFTLAISTYYIPKLSEIENVKELKHEVRNAYKISLPIVLVILSAVYFLRGFVIKLLSSDEFLEASDLFLFQLTGDFFKINAQVLSFILVARAWIKTAIIIEVVYNIMYLLLLYLLVNQYNLIGAPYAYALSYLIYFMIFIVYYKFVILKKFHDS